MLRWSISLLAGMVAVALLLVIAPPASAGVGYDVGPKLSQDGTAVPDVNKVANPPAPPLPALPAPPDETCWQATAANILAGAGWGKVGNTAAQNATAIYGQLTNHFGYPQLGWGYVAINWWLINYGQNPNAADPAYYKPTGSYTDVTYVSHSLTNADYDFLLSELNRCQYVSVSLQKPAGSGHEMTLVGGNNSPWPPAPLAPGNPQTSIWHDSDRTLGADDAIANVWSFNAPGANWGLDYVPGGGTWWAEAYTTLCPGLHKPTAAIENYDAAYYKDVNVATDGSLFNTWRIAGTKANQFGQPQWDTTNPKLTITNEAMPDPWKKEVWLLVDYFDRDNNVDPGILLATPAHPNGIPATDVDFSNDNGQILFYWLLDDQPPWEQLIFPDAKYKNLSGDVKDWDLATQCTPEPATLALVGFGVAGLLARRRTRK